MAKNINDIKKEAIDFIAKVNDKNPYYVVGICLVVIFLLDYFLVMQFQLHALQKLNPAVMVLGKEIRQTREDINQKAAYQNQIRNLTKKMTETSDKVKRREELPLLIDAVTRLARKQGVEITEIFPNSEIAESLLKNKDGQYYSIPLVVSARSGYHEFGRFINQLEREEPFLLVGDFHLRANPSDQNHHDVKMDIKAIVYELKDNP